MYKKILIPLDGSVKSTSAIQHAIEIATKMQSKITLFHVVPAVNPMLNKYGDRLSNDSGMVAQNDLQIEGETLLKGAYDENVHNYQMVETKLSWGHPAQEICNQAKEGHYDLIVMSSRGLSQILGYLMGSVSSRVIKHAHCPVLIVR